MTHWLRPFSVVLVLAAAGLLLLKAQPPPRPPDSYHVRVDVQLVLVPASVSARDGHPVTDLGQDSFEVYENGKLRPIQMFERQTALPLQLVLLIDASLSAAKELPVQKEALGRFIQRVLRPEDAAALLQLSTKDRVRADFSSDGASLQSKLRAIRPHAGTALYDALVEACGKLKDRPGRRVIVVVSDGNDTVSKSNFHAALRAAHEAEATIFALVVRPIPGESGRSVRGEHALMTFSDLTGGRVFFPAAPMELNRFFDELSALLRTQYLIGYQPAPASYQPEFRTIEVRVKGTDYLVQHRKGYYSEPNQ